MSANSSILKKTDSESSKLNQRIDRYKANEIKTKNDQETVIKENKDKAQEIQNPKIENVKKTLTETQLKDGLVDINLKNTKKSQDPLPAFNKSNDAKSVNDKPEASAEDKPAEEKPIEKVKPIKISSQPRGNFLKIQ